MPLALPVVEPKMFGSLGKIPIIGDITGSNKNAHLKGNVVLVRKTVLGLDVTSIAGSIIDGVGEFLGRGVTCQLISSTVVDPSEQSTLPPCRTSFSPSQLPYMHQ